VFIMNPYSYDLRERVVRACLKGLATRQLIAEWFDVSTSWIRRLLQRLRQTGSFAAKPPSGGAPLKLTARHEQRLIAAVKKRPDATLEQLRKACGAPVTGSAIGQHLQKLKLRRKKKRLHPSEQADPEVARQREQWHAEMAREDPQRLVFVDELGAQTTLTPLYGRARPGERVNEAVPADHWHTTTLVEAMGAAGPLAPMELDGAMDGAAFQVWVERLLAPELRPGDIVIWDNLGAHKTPGAKAAVEAVGATLKPLPPHSPDLNPIESMGGKIKECLRRAKARAARALTKAIKQALATITPEDIQGWNAHCGYRSTVP
jgi:transposase